MESNFPTGLTPNPKTMSPSAIVVFDIDGVVRDVANSYRRAIADTVEHFTAGAYRPTPADIDILKLEGVWNNDWEASQELVYRFFEAQGQSRPEIQLDYETLVAFFQARYRGPDPQNWTGYICDEPLLLSSTYLASLTQAGFAWGFFSGATRASAAYVLEKRLGLQSPILVAMEDAPSKPDPTGLLETVRQLEVRDVLSSDLPVLYVGDTVADLYTVQRVQTINPSRAWVGVGVLPPHVQDTQKSSVRSTAYVTRLQEAGAAVVLSHVEQLTPDCIQSLLQANSATALR